jgi:hypothetical protein
MAAAVVALMAGLVVAGALLTGVTGATGAATAGA